ncbi:hypothetical protein M0R45_034815 [Rubus argutus]|uniref:Uncharacterized protein n=1 Tax=Rubus argutus TaxID=59490 RepID=A0AAW1VU83_RUBAR
MDKSWIHLREKDWDKYEDGVVKEDIMVDGFWETYRIWTKHGENLRPSDANHDTGVSSDSVIGDDMLGMIHEAIGISNVNLA